MYVLVSEQCFNTSYERYSKCAEFQEDFRSAAEQVAKRNEKSQDYLQLQVAVVYGHSEGTYFKNRGMYGPMNVHIYVEGRRHMISGTKVRPLSSPHNPEDKIFLFPGRGLAVNFCKKCGEMR